MDLCSSNGRNALGQGKMPPYREGQNALDRVQCPKVNLFVCSHNSIGTATMLALSQNYRRRLACWQQQHHVNVPTVRDIPLQPSAAVVLGRIPPSQLCSKMVGKGLASALGAFWHIEHWSEPRGKDSVWWNIVQNASSLDKDTIVRYIHCVDPLNKDGVPERFQAVIMRVKSPPAAGLSDFEYRLLVAGDSRVFVNNIPVLDPGYHQLAPGDIITFRRLTHDEQKVIADYDEYNIVRAGLKDDVLAELPPESTLDLELMHLELEFQPHISAAAMARHNSNYPEPVSIKRKLSNVDLTVEDEDHAASQPAAAPTTSKPASSEPAPASSSSEEENKSVTGA